MGPTNPDFAFFEKYFFSLCKQSQLMLTGGGTTLNQLPIGLHVKILTFNGRFEAY